MPAVMPALVSRSRSSTNSRSSSTRAAGASAASSAQAAWWVVQSCPSRRPARAASSAPEQIETRRWPGLTSARSQATIASSAARSSSPGGSGSPSTSSAVPASTTVAPSGSGAGRGPSPERPSPIELVTAEHGPTWSTRKRTRSWIRLALRRTSTGPATSRSRVRGGHTTTTAISAGPLTPRGGAPVRRAPPRPWRCGRSARPAPVPCGPGSRRRSKAARRRPSSRT